jgi:hypothetical protein
VQTEMTPRQPAFFVSLSWVVSNISASTTVRDQLVAFLAMGPKQKGGAQKQKGNAAEEVEETLQAVVCFSFWFPGFRSMLTEGIGSCGYLRDPIRAIYAGQTTGMSGKKSVVGTQWLTWTIIVSSPPRQYTSDRIYAGVPGQCRCGRRFLVRRSSFGPAGEVH